jgi:hypothetical protein
MTYQTQQQISRRLAFAESPRFSPDLQCATLSFVTTLLVFEYDLLNLRSAWRSAAAAEAER